MPCLGACGPRLKKLCQSDMPHQHTPRRSRPRRRRWYAVRPNPSSALHHPSHGHIFAAPRPERALPGCARRLRYEDRAPLAKNAVGQRLFELIARKQTNLSVAADVDTADQMLVLAEQVRPEGKAGR